MTTILAAVSGCSRRPAVVDSVEVDIPAVCARLIESNDSNADGKLSKQEVEAAPPFSSIFDQVDTNDDGNLSVNELQSRLDRVFNPNVGMLSAECRVTNKGRPVRGATICLIPAEYLEVDKAMMPIACGVTSDQGLAQVEIHPDDLPPDAPKVRGFVRPGLYQVEVKLANGEVPHGCELSTNVGVEISPQTTNGGPIQVRLNY